MRRITFLLMMCAFFAWGQNTHPRIWLDSATVTRLTASYSANSRQWQDVKADADTYATYSVPPFDRTNCAANQICYSYQGGGWYGAVLPLAIAYRMTGNTTYSAKLKQILAAMTATNGNTLPLYADSGYPTRFVIPAFAIIFDWAYDQLTPTEKANAVALANYWYGLYTASPSAFYDIGCTATVINPGPDCTASNYATGHLVGFGLMGLALEGESGFDGTTINTAMKSWWDTKFAPGFQTGYTKGGMLWQGYNYGPNMITWLMEYLWARKTAGKGDELALFDYITPFAKRHIYDRTPDNWRVYTEGDWPGNTSYIMPYTFPLIAIALGNSTTGGWMRKFYDGAAVYSGGSSVPRPDAWARFIQQDMSVASVDYTATLPLNTWFDGDYHTISRSDWTTSAIWGVFNGNAVAVTDDHLLHSWGNIEIVRGSDHLLISPAQWRSGADGATGDYLGGQFTRAGWQYNTLFMNDGSVYCLDQTNVTAYLGCQMMYAEEAGNSANPPYYTAPTHKETADYAYSKQNLRPGYDSNSWNRTPAGGSVKKYIRSFLSVGGVFFVYDLVGVANAAYDWRLLWWMNPAATSTLPAANVMKSTVGTSTLWGKLLLPATGTITLADGKDSFDNGTTMTKRFDVRAAAGSTGDVFLTVLAPTASSVPTMPTTTLIDATTYKGAVYDDGTPRVAIFSADGTAKTNVTYTATYAGIGRHVIADLGAGFYSVSHGGTILLANQTVGADGTLSFSSASGDFSVTLMGGVPAVSPCDLNGDGAVNMQDVQIAVNQALGLAPCGSADLNRDGVCNVIDVQRVVAAATGQACRVGQ